MMEKKFGSENFFKPSGVGDLWVPSVSDFASEYPLPNYQIGMHEAMLVRRKMVCKVIC